jgi:hypothetical protein
MLMNFAVKYLFRTPQVSFTCSKMGVCGCNCPPNEVVLCIFIAVKILSSLAGFEPANLGSTGKHDNH